MNPTPADRPAFRPEPPDLLAGRGIALGVSGSIAAYKALALTSGLVQAGARVDVILTQAATELLRPLAFQALTHRPVVGEQHGEQPRTCGPQVVEQGPHERHEGGRERDAQGADGGPIVYA